jgi:hypothetical protein
LTTSYSEDHTYPPSKNNENDVVNDVNSLSLRQTVDYCLDVLKIKDNSEIYRNITKFIQKKVPLQIIKTHGNWITAMMIIADCSRKAKDSRNNNSHTFSQSQLYDFLTLATKVIEEEKGEQKRIGQVNNILLKIMKDIMENYNSFDDTLKSDYPGIIVDIISILHKGIDTKSVKINLISIDKYYQSRKIQATTTRTTTITTPITTASAQHKDKNMLYTDLTEELIESLSQITSRRRNELEESLARLQKADLKRIHELCHNYSRLQKYSNMITGGLEREFKKEIQRELKRKLEPHQLRRAIESVRRVRTYIENILDNKFIPDASHGINHVKHNLEYGYQLMDLIERRRQRPQ